MKPPKSRKKKTQRWFVYVIETESLLFYTGVTTDLERRFNAHREGTGAKFFRMQRPKQIIYSESFKTKGAALKRECQIKKLSRSEKQTLTGYRTASEAFVGMKAMPTVISRNDAKSRVDYKRVTV